MVWNLKFSNGLAVGDGCGSVMVEGMSGIWPAIKTREGGGEVVVEEGRGMDVAWL